MSRYDRNETRPGQTQAQIEQTEKDERRKKRIPVDAPRQRLDFEGIPGYVIRWFNDEGGRLQQALEGGYEFVESDKMPGNIPDVTTEVRDPGSRVCRHVGTSSEGTPLKAYLMKIKEEWYKEDRAEHDKRLDEIDRQIYGGNPAGDMGDEKLRQYIPKNGISIKRE